MRDPTELAVLVDALHQLRVVYLTLYHDGFPLLREASPLWAILRSEGLLKFSEEIPLALGTYRGPPWWLVGRCATPDGPMGMYFSGVLLLRLITFYSRPWKVGNITLRN